MDTQGHRSNRRREGGSHDRRQDDRRQDDRRQDDRRQDERRERRRDERRNVRQPLSSDSSSGDSKKAGKSKRSKLNIAGLETKDEPIQRDYYAMNAQQRQERREEEMNTQEEQLDDILGGVKRIKHHANAMNNEVTQQNVLIDDISDNIGRAETDLEAQTAKAIQVNKRKKSVCRLYVFIALLIVAIVIVISVPSS